MNTLIWQENQQQLVMVWRNESQQKPPKAIVPVIQCSADAVLKNAHTRTATLWRGDFHQAKSIFAALKKRLRKPPKSNLKDSKPIDAASAFHAHRMKQAQYSALVNMLVVEISAGFTLNLPRAPDVSAALRDVYGENNQTSFLLPLSQLLGFIGAHEWHKTGVEVAALGQRIHVPFGVFSPLRGEYLELVAHTPLPKPCQTAFDIGTGSGVLAAILAKRGVPHVVATDNNLRALESAKANLTRLGFSQHVDLQVADLFPEDSADLIVCNPPWVPAKPTSTIEAALYDSNSAMLNSFLTQVTLHLNKEGEAWLIMSNLAEHLGLRAENELSARIKDSGLHIVETRHSKPTHAKAADVDDALAFARSQEITTLYRLKHINKAL